MFCCIISMMIKIKLRLLGYSDGFMLLDIVFKCWSHLEWMLTLYNVFVPYRLFSAEIYLDQIRAEPWMRRTARMSWSTGTSPTEKEKDLPCPSSLMTVCNLASIYRATQEVLCALNDLCTTLESLIHEIIVRKVLFLWNWTV